VKKKPKPPLPGYAWVENGEESFWGRKLYFYSEYIAEDVYFRYQVYRTPEGKHIEVLVNAYEF
jgi:hypothetical protein